VLLEVTRILRRWRPIYNQELGDWLDSVIRKLEIKATLPPRICWNGEMKLGSVMSVSQSSAQHRSSMLQLRVISYSIRASTFYKLLLGGDCCCFMAFRLLCLNLCVNCGGRAYTLCVNVV